MQIQMTLLAFASTAMLLFGSTTAHADPDKDESRGKERREGRGFESHGERKHEYKDGARKHEYKDGKYEYKDGERKYEYKEDGKHEYKDRRGKYEHNGDDKHSRREGRGSWFHEHGYANLGVPHGHLPPPGECRIWYPGRPAGHQPPPGMCGRLSRQVPAGAWLMRRPDAEPQYVDVTVYDQRRPGVVLNVGIFDAHTGSFIRIDGSR